MLLILICYLLFVETKIVQINMIEYKFTLQSITQCLILEWKPSYLDAEDNIHEKQDWLIWIINLFIIIYCLLIAAL